MKKKQSCQTNVKPIFQVYFLYRLYSLYIVTLTNSEDMPWLSVLAWNGSF